MEELNNLYKKKYKEVERKYHQYCQIARSELTVSSEDQSLYQTIDTAVRIAGQNYRVFFERVDSPSEFRLKIFDLLGSNNKYDLYTFCDRIGEKYSHSEDVEDIKCCEKELQQISENYYRCPVCFNTIENYDTSSKPKVGIQEKSNKYKRFEYFMDIIRTNQKKFNFKISESDMEILVQFFREVEGNWYKIFPIKSFISYPFLFRKGLELLGNYDYILKIWKIKNSDENIKKTDQKWKKVCELLNYEFIPSG